MRYEDPWEFEHHQVRANRHEQSWLEYRREDFPDEQIPFKRIVCPQCDGRGTSSLYLGSFSGDDMYEDPDFAEDYFRGNYDRTCESCDGRNVVEIIDVERLDPEVREEYEEWMRDGYESDAIYRAERRMGA